LILTLAGCVPALELELELDLSLRDLSKTA